MEVHLIDGTYELFRHFYALPSAKDSEGREVAAVRGVLGSLLGMMRVGRHTSGWLPTMCLSPSGTECGLDIRPDTEDAEKTRYPAKETAAKHERILKEASRLFRERGFENVTVGEVMKGAGLTHGAFYAHFGSKQELQEAAVAYGQGLTASRTQSYAATKKGKRAYAHRYLSPWHRDNPGEGCTMAALAQEVARSTPELKAAFEKGFEEILSAQGGDRKDAIFQTAALLGGVALARAVQDEQLSEEILRSVRQKLG